MLLVGQLFVYVVLTLYTLCITFADKLSADFKKKSSKKSAPKAVAAKKKAAPKKKSEGATAAKKKTTVKKVSINYYAM